MAKAFICLADYAPCEIWSLLESALSLKRALRGGGNEPVLAGKTLAMVFQKPSLRTRVSFDVGMAQLGGRALYLSPDEIRLGARESIADAARVLSRYVDGIMARVFAHSDILELARWASVPVINGLSDYNHPCQGLTDLLTIYEKRGKLDGVRLAYVGDGNNVLHSLLFGGALMGMHIVAATPPGYEPLQEVRERAQAIAGANGAILQYTTDPVEAATGADVIYTDTWTSMGQEAEAQRRQEVFPPYQVNDALVKHAKPDVGVMHCLPAHRGEEITDSAADGANSWLFDQAENRLHAQKAILVALLKG
ncbi:MAG: ornithine carbamoyltransferase [Chloroflexi bacterium]|nr:ornithine carbamoyltransferase [Chloroflexota bacterium]